MVVVGIIAILGAILIPVVSRVRGSGRLVQCISNLRQFDAAFKSQDPNRPDTRLPQAEMWMSVIANSAPGAEKLLQCPDGAAASGLVPDGSSAQFYAWRGNGTGNPNGSRLNGNAAWRGSQSAPTADGSYTMTYKMKPSGPNLVITYKPLGGNQWKATVTQHPGNPYRIDAIVVGDGQRFIRVAQGFSVDYDASAGSVDYGFNSLASGLDDTRAGKIIAMDFNKSVFDFDGYQTPALPDDYLPARALSRRHLKKINALLSDGSVQSFRPDELPPANDIYAIAKDRGPNPGTAEPATDTTGSTGSSGSGNGNGNGNGSGNGNGNGSGNGNGNGSGNGNGNGNGNGKGK